MTRTKASFALALVAAALAAATASPAQAQRAFVAAQGSDANPCSFALPCRTFQHAHDTVAAGGEIDVLDPAGYGPLTITKSISIQGHGFAGISVASGANGITINAGVDDAVSLDGLIIDGGTVGATGINFTGGRSLNISNCVVRRMASRGVAFAYSRPDFNDLVLLSVSDSQFNDNGADGMHITAHGAGAFRATLDRVGFYGNTNGLYVDGEGSTGNMWVAVTDSIAANGRTSNAEMGSGFFAVSSVSHASLALALTRVRALNYGNGIVVSGGYATARLSRSSVLNNFDYALRAQNNAHIYTYGDNDTDGFFEGSENIVAVAKH